MNAVSFRDVLNRLWTARMYILTGGVIGICAALIFIKLSVPQYQFRMTLAPANTMNGAEMSSLMGNDDLFALRYMMQRVGVSGSSDFTRFETMMTGQAVADLLLQSDRIEKGLKSAKRFYYQDNPVWTPPTLSAYLSRSLDVDPVGATALRHIVFKHPDPAFGTDFLTLLHGITDGLIRRQIKDDAQKRVAYLKQTIDSTQNPDHRRVLTTLLMEQERLKMLVSMDSDYAATLVEPPSRSAKPVFPNNPLSIIVMMLAGMACGYGVFSLRYD